MGYLILWYQKIYATVYSMMTYCETFYGSHKSLSGLETLDRFSTIFWKGRQLFMTVYSEVPKDYLFPSEAVAFFLQ